MNIFFMIGQCTQNAFENLEEFSFIFSAQKGTFLLTALPHISKTNLDLIFMIFIWTSRTGTGLQELLGGLDPRTDQMCSVALSQIILSTWFILGTVDFHLEHYGRHYILSSLYRLTYS